MVKISPSVLAADLSNLADEVVSIEKAGADMVHLDVMDGRFVPNITFGMPVVKSLREKSNLIFDVHLMIVEPEKYAMIQMRSHAAWYFRHLPQSKKYRVQLVNISTYDELKNICLEYLDNLT